MPFSIKDRARLAFNHTITAAEKAAAAAAVFEKAQVSAVSLPEETAENMVKEAKNRWDEATEAFVDQRETLVELLREIARGN